MILIILCIVFGTLSILFLMGKGSFFIAGYNTASKKEKEQYDEKKLCRVMGVGTTLITVSLVFAMIHEESAPIVMSIGIIASLLVMFIGTNATSKQRVICTERWYRKPYFWKIVIGIVTAVVIVCMMFLGSISVTFSDQELKVSGFLAGSISVEYNDITKITYRKNMNLGTRAFGIENARLSAGNFKNDEFGNYKLYSYAQCHEYIIMETKNAIVVVNENTPEKTQELYEKIQTYIK